MQRAMKITGQRLLDPNLQIQLDYDPATYFYHAHQPAMRSTGAIYARFSPADEWTQLRYDGLPQYYERLTHRNELWPIAGQPFPPLRPLDLAAETLWAARSASWIFASPITCRTARWSHAGWRAGTR